MNKPLIAAASAALSVLVGAAAFADPVPATQPSAPMAPGDYVSRSEYERVLQNQAAMQKQIDQLNSQRAQEAASNDQATNDELDKEMQEIKDEVHRYHSGLESVVIAGDGDVGYTRVNHTDSTFDAGLSPLILWSPTDRILIEGAFDLGLRSDNTGTDIDLTLADISYEVCDHFIIGGGLFAVPFGQYHNHFDPPWINKFPDDPLVFSDGGLAPGSEVGVFGRGAVAVGDDSKLTYDVYVANGPNLVTTDATALGSLNFTDSADLNDDKAVGGRIGFLPTPNMELGYSLMFARVNPDGFENVNALLQAVDFNYRPQVDAIEGTLDMRAEWVWSNIDMATYDSTGALGVGPVTFASYSNGGYAQLCYRPTRVSNEFLRNLELVSRFELLQTPLVSPAGIHEQRWTFGVDYWVTPTVVFKTAYEIDHRNPGPDQNAILLQLGFQL